MGELQKYQDGYPMKSLKSKIMDTNNEFKDKLWKILLDSVSVDVSQDGWDKLGEQLFEQIGGELAHEVADQVYIRTPGA